MGAGLFAKSLSHLRAVDLGFRKEHLITFQLDPMASGYKSEDAIATDRRVMDALSALPGVTAVAYSDYGVLTGNGNYVPLRIEGYQPPPSGAPFIHELVVSTGYLQALGLPLRAGRDFTPADLQKPPHVVLVNEAFAREYFGGRNPVGRRIGWSGQKAMQFEIVGLAADQRYDGPAKEVHPIYYFPAEDNGELSFYVRSSQAPEALLPIVRRTVEKQAPAVPIDQLRSMETFFDATIGDRSRIAMLAVFFGVLATVLAAIGLYGVMAYTVARRTREIGLRMALGAARGDVLGMVMREVGAVTALGLLLGLPSGLALTRLVRAQLYGVSPMDTPSMLLAAAAVAATALLAGILPARRATKVEPIRALRWE
jgi:predicted permease